LGLAISEERRPVYSYIFDMTGRTSTCSKLKTQRMLFLDFNWFLLSFLGQYSVLVDERLKRE
jgi:hypothetical protein